MILPLLSPLTLKMLISIECKPKSVQLLQQTVTQYHSGVIRSCLNVMAACRLTGLKVMIPQILI